MRPAEARGAEACGMSVSEQLLKPLTRATLPQEIVAAITGLIMRRVWRPGDRIPPEKELAARFNVGRSTIREAIKSLVIFGVINSRPGDGSFIREPQSNLLSGAFQWGLLLTERNLGDLVDARVLIEGECAARAAALGDPDLPARLNRILARMREEQNHPREFMELDNRFHAEIAGEARNALYLSLSNTIQSLVSVWYPRRSVWSRPRRRRSRSTRQLPRRSRRRTNPRHGTPCAITSCARQSGYRRCWTSGRG